MRGILVGFVLFLVLIPMVSATDWYVRPAGGDYNLEDGTSYDNAWDGLKNVVWGSGGVEAGDTLYVCGTHIWEMTDPYTGWSWQANINVGISGSEGNRVIIRGDYPGDPGIVWGAFLPSYEAWVDEGNNTYSINLYGETFSDWFFEDISDDSYTLLDVATSVQNCKDNPGSQYAADYDNGNKLYVHRSDNGDPTGNVYLSKVGYEFAGLNGRSYITFLNLKLHHFQKMFDQNAVVTYMRWEGCTMDMAPQGFLIGDGCHHLEIIDSELAWFNNAVYHTSITNNSPYSCTYSGNTIHDIGVRASTQNADAHAFGIQGGYDNIIEDNYLYNCGTAIQTYAYSWMTIKDVIIRRNFVKDGHTYGGANGRGIDLQTSSSNLFDKSGFEVYQNIVSNCTHGIRVNYEQEVKVYNNIMHDNTYGFSSARNYNGTVGANVKLRNNIFFNTITYHIYWVSGAYNYTLDSDYNLFYPVVGDVMYLARGGGEMDFAEWQALSIPGSTFDPNSITLDPLFTDPENEDFRLQPNSPAIDNGTDVGLTHDFEGTPIPQGSAPDIGAYEYQGSGNVYYVDTNSIGGTCSDSNPGTITEPWCGIGKANAELQSGNTVYIREGTYQETILPSNSGTEGEYITYARYGDEEVIITGVRHAADLRNKHYIAIDGIKITNTTNYWVNMRIAPSTHNIIKNCIFDEQASDWAGVWMGGTGGEVGESNYNQILNNTLKGVCYPQNLIQCNTGCHYNLFEGNTFYYGPHVSLALNKGTGGTVTHNVIRNNVFHNYYHTALNDYMNADNSLIEGNIIVDSGENHSENWCGHEADRTAARFEHNGIQLGSSDCIIRNNVLINNGKMGMNSYIRNGDEIWALNNRIYHNTFNKNYRAFYTNTNQPVYGNVLKNNIFYNNRDYEIFRSCTGNQSDDYFINNNILGATILYYPHGATTVSFLEATYPTLWYGNIETNPLFIDEENRDLHLQSGSPMINAGGFLTTTTSSGSGTQIPVDDARYFMDGWGIIEGDLIQLEGQTQTARITNVDYDNNIITVDRTLTWSNGDGVSLPYSGSSPDIGAYEYVSGEAIPGDLDYNGDVDIDDLIIVTRDFGKTTGFDPRADVIPNNEIDVFDVVFVASRFT